MSNKTEEATPHKLKKAKEKGQVSKSNELNTSFFLFVMILVGSALGPSLFNQIKALMVHLLHLATQLSFHLDNLLRLQHFILATLTNLWLPFALTAIIVFVLSTLSQTGFIWTAQPLKPDMKRLSLVQGFKRLFSSKLVFETVKSSLKLSLVILLMFFSLHYEIPTLLKLMAVSPSEHPALIMHILLKLLLRIFALLFILAVLDKIYLSWKYKKDNRMSKQEIKDEYRQSEGDPKIKLKIKQLQQQLRQKTAALEQVRTADVVITNPTHLALALKYERQSMPAPKIVCKAQGEFAERVRALAQRHKVPIIQNIPFARALFATTELNQWISQEHFPTAAAIFRDIYRQRELSAC